MPLSLVVNGQMRSFEELEAGSTMNDLLLALDLKADRIALEHNGTLSPRRGWHEVRLAQDDKIELVHFVGGG